MPTRDPLRAHLVRLLDWEEAHVGFDRAVDDLAPEARGRRPDGLPHSPWEILEHLRIAQSDLLDFCVNPRYAHALEWPKDYWPRTPAPPHDRAWSASARAFRADRDRLEALVGNSAIDLLAPVPSGTSQQTYLRAILLAADHNAYHLGELVAVRRALGAWNETT